MSKWGEEESETLNAIRNIDFSGNILNVAAGDGRFNTELLAVAENVLAIDIDPTELATLKENTPQELVSKLATQVVDITKTMPFADATFDGLFCTGALHLFQLDTLIKIIDELKRVLKDGGKLVIDFATEIKRFSENGQPVIFADEGRYSTDEAIKIFNEAFSDFEINIDVATFREDNLETSDAGYKYIEGEFLVVSGIKRTLELKK